MKWISVNEDLPNVGFEVIVNDKYGCVSSGWYVMKGFERVFVDHEDNTYQNITHWQPLPVGIVQENQ